MPHESRLSQFGPEERCSKKKTKQMVKKKGKILKIKNVVPALYYFLYSMAQRFAVPFPNALQCITT